MIPRTAIAAAAAITVLLATQTARAQRMFTYDVKVICGQAEGRIAAPGLYWTAVNLLNPNRDTIKVEARVAVALPGFTMGPLSGPKTAPLRPDRAFEIDCPSLMRMSDSERFLKGYVILRSRAPLTVVAVYTQADLNKRAVSMHTERVPARGRR